MEPTKAKRKHGGVSRSLDFLISSIRSKPARNGEEDLKALALMDLTPALLAVVEQTRENDADCGYFLAELTSFLLKKAPNLALENNAFSDCYSKWRKVRTATTKNSALRTEVHGVILDAASRRRRYRIAQHMPGVADLYAKDEPLACLPELGDTPEIVEQWFSAVVYPELYKRRDDLERDAAIGRMKKAFDENGKFQLSRLKDEIRAIVARIAKLPRNSYFQIR